MKGNNKTGRRPSVFISYAKDDAENASQIADYVETIGADPWLDQRKLALGDDWEFEIKQAVASADVFVVCLRPGFDDVGFRQKEVRWAIDALQLRPPGKGFIIPFIIEPCELPAWCEPFHAGGDITKPTSLQDLVRAIRKHCGRDFPPRSEAQERVESLSARLMSSDATDRETAARELGMLVPESLLSVPSLIPLLSEENTKVLRAAVDSLKVIRANCAGAVPLLLDALKNSDPRIRRFAAEALGERGPMSAEAVPGFIEALGDTDGDVRLNAAVGLASVGPPGEVAIPALPALKSAMHDIHLRSFACEAIANIGEAAVPDLLELAGSEDAYIRADAILALGSIRHTAPQEIVQRLIFFLRQDKEHSVKMAAIQALGNIGFDAHTALSDLQTIATSSEPSALQGEARKAINRIAVF